MNLDTYSDYARGLLFLLADRATIASHTLAVYTVHQTVGVPRGEIVFCSGYVLRVFEQIDFVTHPILNYSYELINELCSAESAPPDRGGRATDQREVTSSSTR